jgi:hypothetical protein
MSSADGRATYGWFCRFEQSGNGRLAEAAWPKIFHEIFWGIPSDWPETGKGGHCASPVFSSAEGLWS